MSDIIMEENKKTDSKMTLDQNFVFNMAKERAFHSLEFIGIGLDSSDPVQRQALKSSRDAVVRSINDFGQDFVQETVYILQDRGILPSSVDMNDYKLKELNQEKVLTKITVNPLLLSGGYKVS